MNKLRSVMLAGTGSDVGKSVLTAAVCRILKQDGYSPAPFKAQNMALNSYVTEDGLEIGRAQAVQAEAAGLECRVEMNPVLLKPASDQKAQVIVNGEPLGHRSAADYFSGKYHTQLFAEVCKSYDVLCEEFNPVVLEGAGSVSEMNLWDRDIVNLPMAEYADATVILIADIDRGGVFASVYGSIKLLPEKWKKLVKGIIVNKFRGDISLFEDGRSKLEELTGVPVLGVVPYFRDIHIEEEDSVALKNKSADSSGKDQKIKVAVVLLRHMSNFTDFNRLERDTRVHLYYCEHTEDLKKADIIILPGTKSTMADLQDLRARGVAETIVRQHENGIPVYGVCGGYQMMGQWLEDPDGVEGGPAKLPGLGILPIITRFEEEKKRVQTSFKYRDFSEECIGYEIHMGQTEIVESDDRFERTSGLNQLKSHSEGVYVNDSCWGTYMHGIFDNQVVIDDILSGVRDVSTDGDTESITDESHQAFKERQYELLADHVRSHLDMKKFYDTLH